MSVALPPADAKDLRDWIVEAAAGAGEAVTWPALGRQLLEQLERLDPSPPSIPDRYVPFPTGSLPNPLREYAERGAAAHQCDPAYFALPLLVVCAALIGNARVLRLKRGYPVPSVLWGCLLGESGDGKSPALKAVLSLLDPLIESRREEHEQALATWKNEKAQADQAGQPFTKPRPVERRLRVGNVTIEALVERLEENPKGLLLYRDELRGWLQSFTRYGNKDSTDEPDWLSMHDAGPIETDRKTGDKRSTKVPRAAVSVIGTTQPEVARRCLTGGRMDSGLTYRLLMVRPPVRPQVWSEEVIDEHLEASAEISRP